MELKRMCCTDDAAWEMVATLYENAFPRDERRTREAFAQVLNDDGFYCQVLYEAEVPVGFLTWWDAGDYLYMEHFATLPEVRGRGYGRAVLDIVKRMGKLLVLEAEMPTDALTSRRVAFYERAGFIQNPHRHIQPLYHVDSALLEMRLMTYPRVVDETEYARIYAYIREVVTGRRP